MDIATLIGSILAWILILGAIILGGSPMIAYVDPPSIILVIGGTIAVILVAFPLSALKKLPKVIMKTLMSKSPSPHLFIEKLVEFAEIARRDGILSLESAASEVDDDFIKRGIQMAVDGTDPELIETIMEADLENLVTRHSQGRSILEGLGKFAPALGMIGTLIGLVAMLSQMDDPSRIGAGMAVALLTTLYGALMANLVFLPLADKLALRSADEVLIKMIIIQGVMSIQSGDNPRIVEQKLQTYLPPTLRAVGDDEQANRAA